jgi:hypothetical protein
MQTGARSSVTIDRSGVSLTYKWFGCSIFVLIVYVGFCVALATTTYLRPLPTFDRYLYAGAVASLRYSDPVTIHRIARAEFDAQPSPYRFDSVASEPYFDDVHNTPDHFVQQLGLFRVKLGYVAAGYVLWCLGLPILVGLRLISACCLFVIGLAVLTWTRDAVLSFVLLLTPPVLNLGRMVTADPLSTTLIFLALFALARGRNLLSAGFLIASILVRSDNVFLAVILLAWMVWRRRIRLSIGAILGALAVISAACVNRLAGVYGWRVIMQHGFVKREIEPINHPVLISFSGYLHSLGGLRAIPYTFMTIWVLVAAAVWKRLPPRSIFRELLPLAGVCIVLRLIIFPNFDDRFFVWAYLLAGAALIQTAQIGVCLDD